MKLTLNSIIFTLLLQINFVFGQADTTFFTFDKFMEIVSTQHPMAKRAELQEQLGQANLMSARGAFDPVLFNETGQKYFNDDQYYSIINSGLKIPTWVGIDISAGYETTDGIYLNPELTTPNAGLVYAGVSIPIGQGLFIDKRRADLKKAKLFEEITLLERDLMLNELYFKAGKVYWDWFANFHKMRVFEEAYNLSDERFKAIRMSAILGDVPYIDTTEALIQVQNNLLNYQQAQLEYKNSTELLQIYLWDEGIIPLELNENTFPPKLEDVRSVAIDESLVQEINSLINQHPALLQYRLNIDQLEVDRKLKREMLKPTINLKYNAINEPVGVNPFTDYSINNYTWGVQFGMPLFLRRERGDLKQVNNAIEQSELELLDFNANIQYNVKAILNEWATTKEQTDLWRNTVREFSTLLAGERRLFNNGESSIFMINTRELGYVNAQIKYLDLLNKNRKAEIATSYTFGILSR